MGIDRGVVRYVADLARLGLCESEETVFCDQLNRILEYVEKMDQLDTEGVDPCFHAVPLSNVFRDDLPGESLPNSELERIAPNSHQGQIVVPKIIE